MDTFNIDLNALLSEQVKEKIVAIEAALAAAEQKGAAKERMVAALQQRLDELEVPSWLMQKMRESYANVIQHSNLGEYYRFKFIKEAMNLLFGVELDAINAINAEYANGNLLTHLAISFYSNKELLIRLLRILLPNPKDKEAEAYINGFVMPFHYEKEKVVEFVKSPHIVVNGEFFSINNSFIQSKGKLNVPYHLMMMNPHILEDDVFELLLESIRKKIHLSILLIELPKYNKDITPSHIARLGARVAVLYKKDQDRSDRVIRFLIEHMQHLSDETLEYLYKDIHGCNYHLPTHWTRFPTVYQIRFMKEQTESKGLWEIFRLLNDSTCKWTVAEKEQFIKEVSNV